MARKHHAPWAPTPWDRRVTALLGPHAAWLPLPDGTVAFARHPREPGTPRSAVLDLVLGVEARWPEVAHALLRRRIRAAALAPFDPDVARVAAKRVSAVEPLEGEADPPRVDLGPDAARARALARLEDPAGETDPEALLRRLEERAPGGGPRQDRPIAAVLVGPDGAVVGAARNLAGAHRTLHAELALLQALPDPPREGTLHVSLQCCRMCAAVLLDVVPGVRVRYLRPDPGPLARHTALARAGREEPW